MRLAPREAVGRGSDGARSKRRPCDVSNLNIMTNTEICARWNNQCGGTHFLIARTHPKLIHSFVVLQLEC